MEKLKNLPFSTLSKNEMKKVIGGDPGNQDYQLCFICVNSPHWAAWPDDAKGECIWWYCGDLEPQDEE